MLPISSAFMPVVEWAPPCPLAAVVSGAGATTSLVIEWEPQLLLRNRKARRLIVLRLEHSLALFWVYGMQKCINRQKPLNSNLGTDFNHPSGRNLEIVGGVVCRPAHRNEQMVLPAWHSRLRRRL